MVVLQRVTFKINSVSESENTFSIGQAKVREWKDTSKGPKCSDTTLLNMAISHCIQRELFFQCPGLVTSGECATVIDYGKACGLFPMPQLSKKDSKKAEKKPTEN